LLIALALVTGACAPAAAPAREHGNGRSTEGVTGGSAARMPQRTLVVIVRGELPSLAARPLLPVAGLSVPTRIFNATLDHMDEKEVTHPYLAEALPELNTDTWRVLADGGMETTQRLRPNLTWQDGMPLTADDFVFGWRVYATPELGLARSNPFRQMAEVVAPDPRTVLIRWREAYPFAAEMDQAFQALPRHILEQPFQSASGGDLPAFVNLPFWTFEYVGLGPYRVDRWEAGAFIEASAFDGHALGRPRIDRLRLAFIGDPNTALANMLSGEAHFVAEPLLGYEEGATLEREWGAGAGGRVFFSPVLFRMSEIQFRPDLVSPKALLDVRVRRALAHAFDMPGALEVFTGGRGIITFTVTSPLAGYYPLVERVIIKREYDPRTAQRLLEEAGMVRGADGVYVSAVGEPLKFELWSSGGATFERENRIFVDSLRQAGIEAIPQTIAPVRMADTEFRARRPGLFTTGAGSLDARLRLHSMSDIPGPHNRWQGNNRGGWENAEYERVWQAYNGTLDRSERIHQIAQMERLINEDVASIPHYFTVGVNAHTRHLEGPAIRMTPDAPRSIFHIQNWAWRE
jgi:peptide/nickel transport system substrate-binding protein